MSQSVKVTLFISCTLFISHQGYCSPYDLEENYWGTDVVTRAAVGTHALLLEDGYAMYVGHYFEKSTFNAVIHRFKVLDIDWRKRWQ